MLDHGTMSIVYYYVFVDIDLITPICVGAIKLENCESEVHNFKCEDGCMLSFFFQYNMYII